MASVEHPEPNVQVRDGLWILSYNVGGIGDRALWLAHALVALAVDIFMIQEVWSPDTFASAMPRPYCVVFSEVMGVGTGYATGWLRLLEACRLQR